MCLWTWSTLGPVPRLAGTDLGTGYGVRYLHPLLFSDTEGTSDLARELWGVGAHIADQPRVDGCGTCWIRGLAGLSGSLGLFYGRGLRSPLSPLVSLLVWVCYSWRLDICSLTLASRGLRQRHAISSVPSHLVWLLLRRLMTACSGS